MSVRTIGQSRRVAAKIFLPRAESSGARCVLPFRGHISHTLTLFPAINSQLVIQPSHSKNSSVTLDLPQIEQSTIFLTNPMRCRNRAACEPRSPHLLSYLIPLARANWN